MRADTRSSLVQTVWRPDVGEELSLKGLNQETLKHEPERLQVHSDQI